MTLSVTAYHNLHIAPYQLVSLQHVRITKQINEHTRLYFTAIVPEEGKDDYIKMTEAQTKVEVSHLDEKGKKTLLFTGMILNLEIKMVRDIYYMEVEAVSHTYILDQAC
ncbi:hypothetical protein DFP93_104302 [Aneurinibacillus soli]|uniref:Uncharacterized protein n=1 Tax=Aneurinibacillus soli TaxID=1500254 RepID=A0A0U5ATX6_9BACL|nr:hypothetical protein [Aneurinibacillus soli]PYE62649.1 hypothetical protein DFP93_104302 [Aneurinibacillus soli]BAU27210.1 hypothetical protein CB4_01379 [Aneurinibacillus soli]